MRSLFWAWLLGAVLVNCKADDGVSACGGFIKSPVEIPFEKVKVKLLTKGGNLKYETEGAPNNGYYLIPLYDKGEFQLKVEGPPGWSFDPPMVDVAVDGKTDLCSQNKDVNFDFKGFSVIGKVVSKGSTNGPSGVEVSLEENGSKRTLKSLEGGNFVFPAVMPGKYEISFRGEKVPLVVNKDNVRLADNLFVIMGYSLKGTIEWDSPPSSAIIVLANEQEVSCCSRNPNKQLPPGLTIPSEYKTSCVVSADSSGRYEFPCVKSSTNYAVFAQIKTSNGQLMDIAPNKIEFDLSHRDTQLESFQVTGFPVAGMVTGAGEGVEIKVLETGFETTTDKDGRFKLASMRSGKYTIQMKKRGYQFDPKEVDITPEKSFIEGLEADRYEVCGEVKIPDSVEFSLRNIDTRIVQKVFSEVSSGRFCTFLEKGQYLVKPNYERSLVRLSPAEVTITVPVTDGRRLVFSQFAAIVQGRVNCLSGVCAGVKIALSGDTSKKLVANSDGTFRFDGIEPGNYEVCASHSNICFEKECRAITIIDKNIDNIGFDHKGFTLRVESTHKTQLELAGRVIPISAGLSVHCVVESKPMRIKPIGCHSFAGQDTLLFDPKKGETIKLVADKHRLKVIVYSPQNVSDLKVLSKHGSQEASVELKDAKKAEKGFEYVAEMSFPPGADIVIIAQSEMLLFKPHEFQMTMPNDCHSVEFQGKTGIYVEGGTNPAIGDAEVLVTSALDGHIYKTKTLANGKYKAGPLDTTEYDIEANKEGYAFERVSGSNNFKVIKFSRIDVKVVQEGTTIPLIGALISLTGGQDYRNNSKTGSQGELTFIKLSPGKYFLRVMMKEYKFEPLSTMVEVTQGSEANLLIKGKKVAYSVFGKVTSITGEAEPEAVVEAISEGCDRHGEDAVSDENGYYRIRGLKEGCQYELRLKKDVVNQQFDSAVPKTRTLKVARDDIDDVNLIVFRPIKTTQVTVGVHAEEKVLPAIKVVLSRAGSQLYSVQATKFFSFSNDLPRDGREYTVELQLQKNKLPHHTVKKSSTVTFVADKVYKHVDLYMEVAPESETNQPISSSPFVAILSVFVALAVYFRNDIADFIKNREDKKEADRKKKAR